MQKYPLRDPELQAMTSGVRVVQDQSRNVTIPEPTASELMHYDEEVQKQVGVRSNSVMEYSDPPNLLPDEARKSVKDMK